MAEAEPRPHADAPAQPKPSPLAPVILSSQQLFQGRREILIEHAGVRYRLRITRRNKLILQK